MASARKGGSERDKRPSATIGGRSPAGRSGDPSGADGGDVRRLKSELRSTREQLEVVNAELQVVNRELPRRVEELARANSDLRTLLDSKRQADAALDTSERRFSEAQQLAGVGIWEWNLETDETWWSPTAYQLWGLSPAEAPPPRADRKVHPDDRAGYEAAIEAARKSGELKAEWRVILPDGSIRWLTEIGRVDKSEGGKRMLGVTQDVSDRKQTETRLKLLLGELQHRVRNILGVVRSIVDRTVKSSDSVDELAAHLEGRLDTLARTQGIFTRTGDAAVDLEEMIRDELVAVAAQEDQLTIQGPSVRLRRDAAETFALALHELTTNAVKYGALSEPAGRLAVNWRVVNTSKGPRLSLEWRESGVRAVDVKPNHNGFGRELIERGLPYELGATTSLEFGRGGARAVIEMPLNDKVADFSPGDGAEGAEA